MTVMMKMVMMMMIAGPKKNSFVMIYLKSYNIYVMKCCHMTSKILLHFESNLTNQT
jgi:hypothetical protein